MSPLLPLPATNPRQENVASLCYENRENSESELLQISWVEQTEERRLVLTVLSLNESHYIVYTFYFLHTRESQFTISEVLILLFKFA